MIRVLHVLTGNPYGGMQRLVTWLAAEQLKTGQDVLVAPYTENPVLTQELQSRRIPFINISDGNPIKRMLHLAMVIRKYKPSILHLHVGLLAVSLVCLLTKNRYCIGHYHTYPRNDTVKLRILNYINRKLCKRFIGVSRSVSQSIKKVLEVPDTTVYTIYNGIEVRDGPYQPRACLDHSPRYGMASRLVEGKGLLEFLTLAERILTTQPDARFIIAGEGPLYTTLDQLIRERGLQEKIHLLGHVTHMEDFWRSLDVAVFLSILEPFGLTIIEAMEAGTPIVVRLNATGSDEVALTCFPDYCVPMDDYGGLVERCVQLTTDHSKWIDLSRNNTKLLLKNFPIRRMAQNIYKVYISI